MVVSQKEIKKRFAAQTVREREGEERGPFDAIFCAGCVLIGKIIHHP